MNRPRSAILALVITSFLSAGCAQQAAPVQPEVTLPPDALLDEPEVGLTEPRVSVMQPSGATLFARLPPDFSATPKLGASPSTATSVSEVRELILELELVGMAKRALLSVEIVAPDGSIYEAREATVGGDPFSTYRAQFVLPVAGTAIDRSNLSGNWAANYFIAGRPIASHAFELSP